MDLDTIANFADIIAIPIGIVGVFLVLHQLYLTRIESEREHLRMKNEMTLNAYTTIRKDLRLITARVRNKLNIKDMFDHVTKEQIDEIMRDKDLRHDVAEMLSLLNKFSVGVKHDIFSIDILNELSGKFFIKTHNQFSPYLKRVRKNSHSLYSEYDNLVEQLKIIREYNMCHLPIPEKKKFELSYFLTPKIVKVMGLSSIIVAIGSLYINNSNALLSLLNKLFIVFFVSLVLLILTQLFYSLKEYFQKYKNHT